MERGSVFFLVFFSFLAFSVSFLDDDFNAAAPMVSASPITGYIVAVVWPKVEQPEHFAIRTLARVLGSEEAARKALLYVYYHALSGFAAKLTTPEQVAALKKQPGVLQVIPSRTLHLDGPEPHVKHPRAEIIS